MDILEAFSKNTSYRKTQNGHLIGCKKGLWEVEGNTLESVFSEALHYFLQYWKDGEYTT